MSKIEVNLDNDILTIHKESSRKTEKDTEKFQLSLLEIGEEYVSHLRVSKKENQNKILFFCKVNSVIENNEDEENNVESKKKLQPVVVVYTVGNKIRFIYSTMQEAYKKLLKINYKVLGIKLNKRRAKITVLAYIENKYKIKFDEVKFYIDKELGKTCKLKEYNSKISKLKMIKDRNIHSYCFKMKDILKDESTINGNIRYTIKIDGVEFDYNVGKRKNEIKDTRVYYNPIKSVYVKNFAVHIRRSFVGNLVLVKRPKEQVENTLKFKILESKLVSKIMYKLGKICIKYRKKKINIFYEKFASKVEEGAYDLFLLFQKYKNTQNYFILDEHSPDYEKVKANNGVVKKYSLKYYWVLYNASNFIATESPVHVNIIRSNNAILRNNFTDKKFIFLQHGVTYLKCHGVNSPFRNGKEASVNYIVVGSKKEQDVVSEMLEINEEQILITGLPIFSKIKYNHINQNSDDYITLMLTWKPYEEHLYNFEESETYKNTLEICNMLKKYIDKEKIIIIAHPKARNLLCNTDLKDSLWDKPISEALEKSKLLITDYSSVCYNSFYQGAGVIFYQPDIELYEREHGKLIPSDDEYIGKRAFNINELENIIKDTIKDNKIDLDVVRTEKFIENYKSINEFSDGENINRIYEKLVELDII